MENSESCNGSTTTNGYIKMLSIVWRYTYLIKKKISIAKM